MRRLLALATALGAAMIGLIALATPSPATTGTAGTPTARVVVRPVHADGRPVRGYAVSSESIPGFTCTDVSAGAVSPNIRYCGFSATYTVACWKSAHHTVLCLRDPRVRKLVRIRYSGTFAPVARPKHPSPQSIALSGREYCTVRDGGAWDYVKAHPSWVGFYACRHVAVYGSWRSRDGIIRTTTPWKVHTVAGYSSGTQTIRLRAVRTAYYVGTAA